MNDTETKKAAQLRKGETDSEARREAARALGSAKTDAKKAAAQKRMAAIWQSDDPAMVEKREEVQAKLKARWEERRKRKEAEKALLPSVEPVATEPKKMGRPSKPKPEGVDLQTEPKKRGRPSKKVTVENQIGGIAVTSGDMGSDTGNGVAP